MELLIRNIEMSFRHDSRIERGNSSPSFFYLYVLYIKAIMGLNDYVYISPRVVLEVAEDIVSHRIKPLPMLGIKTRKLIKSILKSVEQPV